MVAIGLIQKTVYLSTKKPAFQWAGVQSADKQTRSMAAAPSSEDLLPSEPVARYGGSGDASDLDLQADGL